MCFYVARSADVQMNFFCTLSCFFWATKTTQEQVQIRSPRGSCFFLAKRSTPGAIKEEGCWQADKVLWGETQQFC